MKLIDQSCEIITEPLLKNLKIIEQAGRTCYDSHDKITFDSYINFIKTLIKSGHHSVLEHSLYTIKFVTSRAMMAELTRHRLCAFSVQSQRYVKYNDMQIIKPHGYNSWPIAIKQRYADLMQNIETYYQFMTAHGVHQQISRGILPQDMATTIIMSCNMRELMHIIKLRTSKAAHPQMRDLITQMLQQLSFSLNLIKEYTAKSC